MKRPMTKCKLADLLPGDIVSFGGHSDDSMRPDLLIARRQIDSLYTEYTWLELGTNRFYVEQIKDVVNHLAAHDILSRDDG